MNIKLAIVIPVYNTIETLDSAIKSVLTQTYRNIEIFIIDDGSSDGSSELLNQYASKYLNITVIHQENKGQSIARNRALELIYKNNSITHIGFLDSDDEYGENEMLEKYVEILNNDNKIDILQFPVKGIYQDKVIYEWVHINKYLNNRDSIVKAFYQGILLNTVWNKIYKKDTIKNFKFIEGYYYEDDMFNSTILPNLKFVKLVDFGYYKNKPRMGSTMLSNLDSKKANSYLYSCICKLKSYSILNYFNYYLDIYITTIDRLSYIKSKENINFDKSLLSEFKMLSPSLLDILLIRKIPLKIRIKGLIYLITKKYKKILF